MSKSAFIIVVIAVIAVLVLWPRPHRTTGSSSYSYHYSVMVNNMRQLDGAKAQWQLEHMPASNVWPSKIEIRDYLGRGFTSFEPVNGEIYVINRADRPVAVYLTKDAFGWKEGQLLTIEDIQGKWPRQQK